MVSLLVQDVVAVCGLAHWLDSVPAETHAASFQVQKLVPSDATMKRAPPWQPILVLVAVRFGKQPTDLDHSPTALSSPRDLDQHDPAPRRDQPTDAQRSPWPDRPAVLDPPDA